jgi:hypothetical protein
MTYLQEEEFENYSIRKDQVNRWISQYFPKNKDNATIGDLIGIIEDLDGEIDNLKDEIKSLEDDSDSYPQEEYDREKYWGIID